MGYAMAASGQMQYDYKQTNKPHKLHGSMKARQESVRPRAWNDRVGIYYNEMMSIYPGVCQTDTLCR